MTDAARLCELCEQPIRKTNVIGVCQRPPCRPTYHKRWRDLDPKNREKGRVRQRQWVRENHLRMALIRARSRATKKGLEYNLTLDAIPPIPAACPVLGIPLSPGVGDKHDGSPSLDRIDSTRGYTVDNVHWISWRANNLKGDATVDELVKLARYFTSLAAR